MIKRHVLHLLLAANLLLACALAALWLAPQRARQRLHWQPPAPQAPQLPQFSDSGGSLPARAPVLVSSFLVTLERPLFSPNRRPAPMAPVTAVAPVDPLANIQLQGVYSTADGGGIFARVDGKNRRIAVGSTLGDWTVRSVAGSEVTLARGEDTQVLRLLPSRLGAAPPAAPPAAAAEPPGAANPPISSGSPGSPNAPVQVEDPVLRQEQERQERERARLALRNARRAAQGFPPVKE